MLTLKVTVKANFQHFSKKMFSYLNIKIRNTYK